MFEIERRGLAINSARAVASEGQKLTAEQRQRDVFESHRHRVFAVSYYMTESEVEAEEILGVTFVTAFARQTEPDADGVDRAMLGELERRFSLDPVEAAVADPSVGLTRSGARRTEMEEAMRALPPVERLAFLLKDVEGYKTPRIAKLLGLSEAETQRTLFSARIRMRNALAAAQQQAGAAEYLVEPERDGVEDEAGSLA